jgi:hypothetical protein
LFKQTVLLPDDLSPTGLGCLPRDAARGKENSVSHPAQKQDGYKNYRRQNGITNLTARTCLVKGTEPCSKIQNNRLR